MNNLINNMFDNFLNLLIRFINININSGEFGKKTKLKQIIHVKILEIVK